MADAPIGRLGQEQPPESWNDLVALGMMQAPPAAAPFPAANSVDWLQQRLPKAMGDWLGNAYAEGERRTSDLGPRSVAGEVIGGALNLLPAGRMAVPRPGIRAYHGSPYDFDRFDMSKIGTGEGAQAYGHGLYFAENPKTAQQYEGMLAKNGYDPAVMARNLLVFEKKSPTEAIADLQYRADASKHIDPIYASNLQKAIELVQGHAAGNPLPLPSKGRMYEVNINAKPEQFLDWDRSLGQQPRPTIEALQKFGISGPEDLRRMSSELGSVKLSGETGADVYRALANNKIDYSLPYSKGSQIARESQVTNELRDAGIPGIRYADQGSRQFVQVDSRLADVRKAIQFADGKPELAKNLEIAKQKEADLIAQQGQGTSNYVLFNDQIIDILKKWSLLGSLGGTAAAGRTEDK